MIKISRVQHFFKKHQVLFGAFLFLLVYHFVIVNRGAAFRVNDITYMFYAVDYSMGFCSRFLPGALYHVLVGIYNETAVSIYLTVLYIGFVLLLSYLVEKFANAFPDNRKTVFILMILFLSGPFTFEMIVKDFGMLDFYWMLFFAFSCLLLRHKYLRFLIPFLVALMISTHYGALVCYVAALLLLILFYYMKSTTRGEKTAYAVVFAGSLLIGVSLTLYFLINDANNLVYPVEKFDQIVFNERHAYTSYYDFYLYKYVPSDFPYYQMLTDLQQGSQNFQSIQDLIASIVYQVKTTFSFGSINKYLLINFSSIPLFLFLGYIMFSYFKDEKNLFKRFLTILFVTLSLIIGMVGMVLSTDNTRWLGHSIIILFVFVFYVLYFDYREGIKKIQALFSKTNDWLMAVLLFFYASTVVDPYTFVYVFLR